MLRVNNIEVVYNGVILILRGVSLQVGEGSIVCLLGVNGAGKTTTLKAISGLLHTELGEVTRGNIQLDDDRIDGEGPEDIVERGIVQVLEGRMIFEHLTVEENLMAGTFSRPRGCDVKTDLNMVYSRFPKLRELRSQTSGYLSGGEQQMLVIGRALMAHPKLILLDEPSLGLAPILVEIIFGIIKDINTEEKTSVLLVEQNAAAALSISGHGYVMENGRIVLEGPADRLKDNEDVREFYLGFSEVGEKKSYREVKHYKRRKRWLG